MGFARARRVGPICTRCKVRMMGLGTAHMLHINLGDSAHNRTIRDVVSSEDIEALQQLK